MAGGGLADNCQSLPLLLGASQSSHLYSEHLRPFSRAQGAMEYAS
jgi:hypothetical protein